MTASMKAMVYTRYGAPSSVLHLEEVAKKYKLPDIGKAVRCLVNYSRENPERSDEIFDEVRCVDC